jgi:eukaryotic-like serine/threonine-protein kinase
LFVNSGRPDKAAEAYRQARTIYAKLAEDFPNVPVYQSRHFRSWTMCLEVADNSAEAERALSKCLELVPKEAMNLNDLAWLVATSPNLKARDPKRAVELASQAVALAPKEGNCWNTLGAAHYRAGDWNASIETLEKSMTLRNGGDANDWFFLAMARWRKGEKEDARKWYGQAVQWMVKNQPKDEELGRFRAEAETLLELKK